MSGLGIYLLACNLDAAYIKVVTVLFSLVEFPDFSHQLIYVAGRNGCPVRRPCRADLAESCAFYALTLALYCHERYISWMGNSDIFSNANYTNMVLRAM